jgi:ribonuclease VapC
VSDVSVIDASAVLAYLQQEKGEAVVEAALDAGVSWITTVNYCEVLSKLGEKGMPIDEAAGAVDDIGMTLIDFDARLARQAAQLRKRTIPIGASLGDRACLALAHRSVEQPESSRATVYTAEQNWSKLKWPFKIVQIRSAR